MVNGHEMKTPSKEIVREMVTKLLNSMNVDWADENFTRTPERVAAAMVDTWLAGYSLNVSNVMTVFPNADKESDLVIVKDIQFYSMCSHHFAPFFGKAAIAYLPDKYVMGLSKAGRVLEVFSRRLQLQERITAQVADALMEELSPKGVMVILYDCTHTCMTSRGIHAHESRTTTQAVRGQFKENPDLRSEVLRLIGI